MRTAILPDGPAVVHLTPVDQADESKTLRKVQRSFSRELRCVGPADAGGGKKSYKLEFTYKLDDMYNWDANKGVRLGGFLPVPDEVLGQMHLAGVAKEYRNVGTHSETFEWVK